jgi:hypothetical protein
MKSDSLSSTNIASLPILFVYIGWADRYDGTEPIKGDFSYFRNKSADISEASAFHPDSDGLYRCGVGRGQLVNYGLNVVLVARDDKDGQMKLVGLYPNAKIEMDDYWAVAACRKPVLIPPDRRPKLDYWPTGQGMRRWASRGGRKGKEYPLLHNVFRRLLKNITALPSTAKANATPSDFEFDGFEGQIKRSFVVHRSRENRLRHAKIREALNRNRGKLVCEVPGCGFNFAKRYGKIGAGYAQVHHRTPLSAASRKGMRTKLSDLAIVCANCHAMIHKGGECRPLKGLIAS